MTHKQVRHWIQQAKEAGENQTEWINQMLDESLDVWAGDAIPNWERLREAEAEEYEAIRLAFKEGVAIGMH